MKDDGVTYREAGVDIEAADALVERIGASARSTHDPGVIGGIGGFAALYGLRQGLPGFVEMRDPLLVSGTDGVGTKLKVAFAAGRHGSIGIDLVAMCVNDVVTCGAMPLFFLDYFGTGALEGDVAAEVIEGIAEGCRRAGCALVGGETAELPGLYARGEYDLAGFAVGIVDRPRMLTGESVATQDVLVGVSSSGLHSNGYSLARKVFLQGDPDLDQHDEALGGSLADVLLEPTIIYAELAGAWMERARPKACAHITGGGLQGNIPRVLPSSVVAVLEPGTWPLPSVFAEIARRGPVRPAEMFKTFNMGLGWVGVFAPEDAATAIEVAQGLGLSAHRIGRIESGQEDVRLDPEAHFRAWGLG